MFKTIVLRYSNRRLGNEALATIRRHQEIIDKKEYVWWGWWKKGNEDFPDEALRSLAELTKREPPCEIGLVNFRDEEYYAATCVRVVHEPGGQPTDELASEATPDYYRTNLFPAWFQLTNFRGLTKEQFTDQFGEVVNSDAVSLFVIDESNGALSPSQKSAFYRPATITVGQGNSVLHLSDLHFGGDHAFQPSEMSDKNPLSEVISERIEQLNMRIAVVVISGDTTTRGDDRGLGRARTFIKDLLVRLGLTMKHVVIVPGNHDIYIEKGHDVSYYSEQEQPYRDHLKLMYDEDREISGLQEFVTSDGWTLRFGGLNSARFRSKETGNDVYGYLGHDRYGPVLSEIFRAGGSKTSAELAKARQLHFAVLHHHVLPTLAEYQPENDRHISLTVDAGRFLDDAARNAIGFVLHGHQHLPFVGRTTRTGRQPWGSLADKPIWVIGCGSSGAKFDRLATEMGLNSFLVYTPTDEGLRVVLQAFSHGVNPETHGDLVLPYA